MLKESIHEGERSLAILEADATEGEWRVRATVAGKSATYQVRTLDPDRKEFRVRKIGKRGATAAAYTCRPGTLSCDCPGRKWGYRCRHLCLLEAMAEHGIL